MLHVHGTTPLSKILIWDGDNMAKKENPVDEPKNNETPETPVSEPKNNETPETPKPKEKETKIFSERFKGKKLIGMNGVEISFDKDGFVEGELDESQKQRLISIGFCEKEVEV